MATLAPVEVVESKLESKLKLSKGPGKAGALAFGVALAAGFVYVIYQLVTDLSDVSGASIFPFLILGVALFIALAFEFVNGFHDTANAVATVIYTHTLRPHVAVVWS